MNKKPVRMKKMIFMVITLITRLSNIVHDYIVSRTVGLVPKISRGACKLARTP